jgi:hypothetical protein
MESVPLYRALRAVYGLPGVVAEREGKEFRGEPESVGLCDEVFGEGEHASGDKIVRVMSRMRGRDDEE